MSLLYSLLFRIGGIDGSRIIGLGMISGTSGPDVQPQREESIPFELNIEIAQ